MITNISDFRPELSKSGHGMNQKFETCNLRLGATGNWGLATGNCIALYYAAYALIMGDL